LRRERAFRRLIALLRKKSRVIYAKPPVVEPEVVLAYLSSHTHRVAVWNRRLISCGAASRSATRIIAVTAPTRLSMRSLSAATSARRRWAL
jgi:hypothetical protein